MKSALLMMRTFAPGLTKSLVVGLTALAAFLFGGSPRPQQTDSSLPGFTSFDAMGAGTTPSKLQGTAAFGINASGEVVGIETDSNEASHGIVRAVDGTITQFDAGSGTSRSGGTLAIGINAGGDVTGSYGDSDSGFHGFVRAAGGIITRFDVPDADATNPFAIDANGDVTGYYLQGGSFHGFLRAASGSFVMFDVPGAGTAQFAGQGTRPVAINTAGEIAGFDRDANSLFHGFVRAASGTITTFDAPGAGTAGYQGTLATAIDDAGDVTGVDLDAHGAAHGFVRTASGTFTAIDVTGAGTGMLQGTFPLGINSAGTIVGLYFDTNYVLHAFLRSAAGTFTTIDAPGAGSGPGGSALGAGNGEITQSFEGTGAFSINDSGTLAGSYLDASSVTHGFLLQSQVAPATFAITGTAVSVTPGATTGNTAAITVTPSGNFTGAVALTATVTASPAGAADTPTLSFGATTPVTLTGATAGTATLTISTFAATSGSLVKPKLRGVRWYGEGGAVLACVLLIVAPRRKRSWAKMLFGLLMLAAIGGMVQGCGGSGGSSDMPKDGPVTPGTTAGGYTVTITGISGATTSTGTVALTVQ